MENFASIAALVISFLAILFTYITNYQARKQQMPLLRRQADTERSTAIESLQRAYDVLLNRALEMEYDIRKLKKYTEKLVQQLKDNKIDPVEFTSTLYSDKQLESNPKGDDNDH